MGPCGPLPSGLHRPVPPTPRRADCRVGRAVDRRPPGRPPAAPRPPTSACRRCRPPPAAGVLRPGAGFAIPAMPGVRRAFVSGKKKQNTIKTTTISDGQGRTLWGGAVRPGRMHDQTAVKTEGIEDLLRQHPTVTVTVDAGYRGLAKTFPDQVHAHHPNRARTRRLNRSPSTSRHASSSPRGGPVWSMPSPSPSSGGRCSAGWGGARTTPRPMWPSLGWSPTGPPAAD